MEFYNPIGNNKGGTIGAVLSLVLGVIGRITLSDTAMIIAIISGIVATGYTVWKWITEYKKHAKYKDKKNEKHF